MPDSLTPDLFLEHPGAFSYCRGKMKNGTIKTKLLLTSVCMHWFSKNGFWKYFSVADCKVKIFCSTEVVNEDTIRIPHLFPAPFSLFPLKQTAVKMTRSSEKCFYFYAITITNLAREWLNECSSSSLNFEHYLSKLKHFSKVSKSVYFCIKSYLFKCSKYPLIPKPVSFGKTCHIPVCCSSVLSGAFSEKSREFNQENFL